MSVLKLSEQTINNINNTLIISVLLLSSVGLWIWKLPISLKPKNLHSPCHALVSSHIVSSNLPTYWTLIIKCPIDHLISVSCLALHQFHIDVSSSPSWGVSHRAWSAVLPRCLLSTLCQALRPERLPEHPVLGWVKAQKTLCMSWFCLLDCDVRSKYQYFSNHQ